MDLVQIRMELMGARTAALEARGVSTAIGGVGSETATAGTKSAAAERHVSRLSRAWQGMKNAARIGAFGIAAGAGLVALQTKAAVEQQSELAMTTAGLHRNLGLSNREGSRWAAVMKARGIDSKSFSMSMTTLSKQIIAGAEDNAAYQDTFARLGLTQDEVKAGTKDFSGFVTRLADAFGDAKGGAERQAIAQKLLGRGYQSVLPLFAEGSKSLEEQLGWADKYHLTMGGQMVDDNMKLVAAQRESKVAWMGIQQTLATMVLPILTDAQGEFQKIARIITDPKLTDAEKIEKIGEKFSDAADTAFHAFTGVVPQIASKIGDLVPKVARAFVNGFLHANAWGKLVLGGWLASKLIQGSLLAKVAGAAATVGKTFGQKFVESSILWLMGTEVGSSLLGTFMPGGKFRMRFTAAARTVGKISGRALGAAFVIGFALALPSLGRKIDEFFQDEFGVDITGPTDTGIGIDFRKILGFAGGGRTPWTGTFLVGERGPELATLPGGTHITPTEDLVRLRSVSSAGMAGPTGGGDLHAHLYLDGRKVAEAVFGHAQTAAARA